MPGGGIRAESDAPESHARSAKRAATGDVQPSRLPNAASLVLSFDLEDWHQLVGRHFRCVDWDTGNSGLERQMRAVFEFLDQHQLQATFFLLGVSIKNYPEIAQEIGRRGDEVACHGYSHELVFRQNSRQFRADLEQSINLLLRLGCEHPRGYRAPAFSINRDCPWAFEVLAELGFEYDSSQYDSPRIPRRLLGIPHEPYRLQLASGRSLIELPPATGQLGPMRLPVGGGSYWRALPLGLIERSLAKTDSPWAALYFHPYECDPQWLRAPLPRGASLFQRLGARYYDVRSELGRTQILARLSRAASKFRVVKYHDAVEEIRRDPSLRTRTLSEAGRLV